jgi:hypothetical protein
MTISTKSISYFTLAALLATLSCNKKDPVPECGCDANPFKSVKNVRASYLGEGGFKISGTDEANPNMFGYACEIDPSWQKSADPNIPDYTISGDFKSPCLFGPTMTIVIPHLKVTSIQKD